MTRADNQQERLIDIGWILGFVDGEGCFSIGFVKQPDRTERRRIRRGYRTGFQIAHEFAVVQGERSIASLEALREFFRVGGIYINRRYDNHKEHLYRYSVTKRKDLSNVIIPFFERYRLRTAKNDDFRLFAECVRRMQKDEHLTNEGAIRIALMTERMNHRKSRSDIIKILRDQTPTMPHRHEERVPSA